MLTGLDHLVILVEELEAAIVGYEELGFRVTPGGAHADGLTRNALIPFADGTYLELAAFVDSTDEQDNVWGWRPFLKTGGGLVDYCVTSDNLASDVQRLTKAGFDVDGPDGGGRRLPEGTEIRWKSARIRQEGRMLPFLIEDETPRSLRVPDGPSAEHANAALGISRLLISAWDVDEAYRALTTLVDASSRGGYGEVALGPQEILVLSGAPDPPRGSEGPLAVEIRTAGEERAELDAALTKGVRILFNRA
jgi:hypothetical protein